MKTNLLNLIFVLFAFLSIFFISCEPQTFNPDSSTAQDNARAEGSIIDVFGLVSSNADGTSGGGKFLNADTACYNVEFSIDEVTDTRTLIITFDSLGCEINGKIFKGKITSIIEGNWFQVGSTMTITFTDFTQDGVELKGTMVASFDTIEGTLPNSVPVHTVTASNMELKFTDGKTITWNSNKQIKWLSGYFTRRNTSDDELQINGTLNGVNKAGVSFTSISADLVKQPACDLFVSGTVTITKGTDIVLIDFGNGDCDGTFTVTQNNISTTVTP